MAGRIQGITVEIGGDTTKLQTALKGVNSEIRNTQSQLKDVEKLLKLDPGNTELLAQKHRLLGDAVKETKEKLETLKTAAEQANTALANGEITQSQYDGLQREMPFICIWRIIREIIQVGGDYQAAAHIAGYGWQAVGFSLLAISHISLDIAAGQHIALVGPSGGGKTTLTSLIARFWDVDAGSILIGGVNVKEIPTEQLMDTVSYVFQDSKLLKTSIMENVRMGRPTATDEEVLEALKAAMCTDILEKLPQGVDTVIGAKGTYVSGGEMQRIAIARAFLKNAPILILDEATAFADPDNEIMVQQAFIRSV